MPFTIEVRMIVGFIPTVTLCSGIRDFPWTGFDFTEERKPVCGTVDGDLRHEYEEIIDTRHRAKAA